MDIPPILWDGVIDFEGNSSDQPQALSIQEPASVGYMSVGIGTYPIDPEKMLPTALRPDVFDVKEPLPVVLPQDSKS